MWVGYADFKAASDHKQVTAAGVGAVKSEPAEFLYQFAPGNALSHAAQASGGRFLLKGRGHFLYYAL